MRIDAHQHFWDFDANAADYVWMSADYSALRRNFGPEQVKPLLDGIGFGGTVAVQARELETENDYLLGLAAAHAFILGVVGWLDLCDPQVEARLARYSDQVKLKGLRMLIHDRPDVDFADSLDHARGIGLLERYGLTYDLLLKPQHIKAATRLVDRFPRQRFVVDHIAKPAIATGDFQPWAADMTALAQRQNVWCKLSSLITQARWSAWSTAQMRPYLDHMLDCFGPQRLMIGSDWPVSTVASDYATTMGLVTDWCARLSLPEQEAILGDACSAFYGLDPQR